MDNKTISSRESQLIMLDILSDFDEYCDKNNLRYCLAYGTLLGAVRHKGFIPWDDDIDVYMPRADYEALKKNYPADNPDSYLKYQHYSVDDNFPYMFARIADSRTNIENRLRMKPKYHGLWIDIVPVDGLWENPLLHPVYWAKLNFLKYLQRAIAYYDPKKKTFNNTIKGLLLVLFRREGKHYMMLGDQTAASCRYEDHEKVCDVVNWAWRSNRQYLNHEDFDEYVKMDFEGRQFRCPKNWKRYLTAQYGDYMQLPPEEKRKRHDYQAYWK